MRNGIFADIQALYGADSELEKNALKTQIMDAGTLDGARYVLPLRFTVPVLVAASEDWQEFDLDPELFHSGIDALVDEALARETLEMAVGIRLPEDLSLLPRLYDYENSEMLLTAESIAGYMRRYQAWAAVSVKTGNALIHEWEDLVIAEEVSYFSRREPNITAEEVIRLYGKPTYNIENFSTLMNYIDFSMYWRSAGLPLFTTDLPAALESAVIAKNAKFDAIISPLRAADGSITASVTYFGAVGSGCQNPDLAYAFLRQFLAEEFQWDIYRPRIHKTTLYPDKEVQTKGLVEDSWPVRTTGSVPYIWSSLKYQVQGFLASAHAGSDEVSRQIQHIDMTDDDFPALTWQVDEVRFPVVLAEAETIGYALAQLNEEDGSPTDVDIDALAQEVYQSLWFHLMEG